MRWRGKIFTTAAGLVLMVMAPALCQAQALLSADGPGNTYELITSVFAPGNSVSAVEAPDASHAVFGRHIAEVFDTELNKYVFEFYSHVTPDNDPSTGMNDRQRVEIKTYAPSPDSLKGTVGETITYKWRFKIPVGFQPSSSFTHVHQIKAVDGDDGDPIFTLTPRKGTPNKLELIYVADSSSGTVKPAIADLSLFEGVWVEATEIITVGAAGKYSINLKKISDGTVLMSYINANISTIRPSNTFIRPKWGIYRSLNNVADLRNEAMRFADFSIKEGAVNLVQTYYWIGGTGPANFAGNNNWNTKLDGTGDFRTPTPQDILIIDGTNIGGTIPTTGTVTDTVTSISISQFKLQKNATVILQRPSLKTGTGTITIGGDGTSDPDFAVVSGSSLTINSPIADGSVVINLNTGATGLVGGEITLSNTGSHQITSQVTGGLVFASGSTFYSNGTPSSSIYPFGSSSQAVQFAVVFQTGANLVVNGTRSPMGNTSSFQACNMMPGSNTYFRSNASTATGSWSNLKIYGNIFIQNGAVFTCDGPFYKIDNLTIDNGCTLNTHTSGHTPVLGNLTVNGILSAPSGSNTLVMGADVPQTISGNGSISVPNLVVANYSAVTLSKNLAVSAACNIYGNMNFMSSQITGTGSFTSKVYSTITPPTVSFSGTTSIGSYVITGVITPGGISGYKVSGTGIPASTHATGFGSAAGQIYLSKPATESATNTFTFTYDSAMLVSSNPNGMDSTTGSVVVTGNKSFQSGTNYIINGNCNWPFGISSSAPSSLTLGKVVINATVTTNRNVVIKNGLYINAGIFNIRPADTVNVSAFNLLRQNSLLPYIKGRIFTGDKNQIPLEYFAFGKQGLSDRDIKNGKYDSIIFSAIEATTVGVAMMALNNIPLKRDSPASFFYSRDSQYWSIKKSR